jgi:hypothetical protein
LMDVLKNFVRDFGLKWIWNPKFEAICLRLF